MNIDWKDLLKRAGWTFLEAFLVALPTTYAASEDGWKSCLMSSLLSACAAGVSAVKTLLVNILKPAEETEPITPAVKKHRVYLSPSGQYGNTYAYGNTNEGTQCVKIAKACELALKSHGFEVLNGADKEYEVRFAEAKEFGPSAYCCIHTNAFNGVVSGTRCFVRSFDDADSYRICKAVFDHVDACCPGTSSNIKEQPNFYEFLNMIGYDAIYVECDFHDVPSVAEFIVNHTTEIGESIAHGICDAFDVAW